MTTTHSPELDKLAAALVKAQAEMENATKNARNPHFKSTYADLSEVREVTIPVLNKHGLSVIQLPGYTDGVVTVDTTLLHVSGQWIRGSAGAPIGRQADAQGVGSATTYLRRYSLAALCGITQEDDDAHSAAAQAPQRQHRDPYEGHQAAPLDPADTLIPFGDKKGQRLGVLDDKELQKLIDWCTKKEAFPDLRLAAVELLAQRGMGVAA